jgi:periplasmic protein TonB
MTPHAGILESQESMRRPFLWALALHGMIIFSAAIYGWISSQTDFFGAKDAGGGAVGVEAVDKIPLPHQGPQNPLASDTKSEVPQTPAKPVEKAKVEKPDPDAIPLKSRKVKKKLSEIASERQKYRPFDQLDHNQITSKQAPAVSNPLYSAQVGAGRIGTGMNTTLGNRFGGYAQQIRQLVAQKWRTGDVDQSVRNAPTVIATFELMRDGSARNVRILQGSGIPSLDFSVQRAILEASPFPPIPPGFDKDYAKVEFWFELTR